MPGAMLVFEVMKNGKNEEEKQGKTRNDTVKRDKICNIFLYCKYTEITIYHARFSPKALSNSVFVGLKIGVDNPGIFAALRPWKSVSASLH